MIKYKTKIEMTDKFYKGKKGVIIDVQEGVAPHYFEGYLMEDRPENYDIKLSDGKKIYRVLRNEFKLARRNK